jgi:DNA repair protein RadC
LYGARILKITHPSGDSTNSAADIRITRLLREAAKTVEITLFDHVIVGRPGADPLGRGYFSFREANWPGC